MKPFEACSLEELLARSTGKPFAESTLALVLENVPPLSVNGPWLGGGAIRRTLLGEEPSSDFDFFFRDAEQLQEFSEKLEKSGMVLDKETSHHKTYTGIICGEQRVLQLIFFKHYEDAQEVADSFDYTICQFVFDGETLTYGKFSLWDLGRKRLVVHKISYPVASMRRLLKYTGQGFYACSGTLQDLLNAPPGDTDIQYVD